ncbi:dihydrofolate reductase family protein [Actinoallomurus sp. NPDC052308]|uniref:dihydrofolate reductase family protein n=1 Tax=Actinoallomurus sp. NPDC052308 TaxID=3155530 RepID=UPI003431F55F
MRKIVYWVHVSIDGHVAGPGGAFDWPTVGPELFGYSNAMNEQVDTLLYGRVVWEGMASYWPTADADPTTADDHARTFAPYWRRTPKVVMSRTLDKADHGARVIGKNLPEEVAELKRQPGRDILLTGGSEAAASLTELGLLDDVRVVVHPVVLGGGPRLLPGLKDRLNLTLVDSRTFDGASVLLHYERRH